MTKKEKAGSAAGRSIKNISDVLSAIHEAFTDLIYLYDIETRKQLYSSKNITELLGYSEKETLAMGTGMLEKIVHPDDYVSVEDSVNKIKALADGEVFETRTRFKQANGNYRLYLTREVVFSRAKNGLPKVILGVSHDITEIEKQKDELEKLALIAQKTTNTVIITNREGYIEWVNPGYVKLTGYSLADIGGTRPSENLSKYKENHEAILRMQKNFVEGRPFIEEFKGKGKTGNLYWLRVFADPITDATGKVTRFIAVGQDITEEKEHQASLEESYQRLKHYAFFTSHQLRAPVADILSILDVLDYSNPENPDNIRLLGDLKLVSERLDKVVHDLNDLVSAERIRYSKNELSGRLLKNVMLVDDDRIFNNITGMILKRLNKAMGIESYTDPAKALEKLYKNPPPPPDVIFLDINMPEINGWAFLESLEKMGLTVDVYMLTSSIDPSDMEKSKAYANVKGYFTKPLTKKVLSEYFSFPVA